MSGPEPLHWRHAVLDALYKWTVRLGGIIATMVLLLTWSRDPEELRSWRFAGMFVPYTCLTILRFSPSLSYPVRAWGYILASILAATGGLYNFGPVAGPVLALALSVVATGLLLDRLAMLGLLALTSGLVVGVGLLHHWGTPGEPTSAALPALELWGRAAIAYGALTGALAVLVASVVESIEEALRETAQALADRDAEQRQKGEAQAALLEAHQALLKSQKLEAIGRLAAGVGHDFNNTLQVIVAWASQLQTDSDPDLLKEGLAEIERAAINGGELPRRLLAFGRRDVRAPMPLAPVRAMRELQSGLKKLLPEDITIETRFEDCPIVRMDPAQLEQVLLNIGINAGEAMSQGGTLTLGAETIDRHQLPEQLQAVDHSGSKDLAWAHLWVTDTGEGMSEAVKENVFELFFTTKGEKGNGLGLATAYAIVRQSGGVLTVDSKLGQGTTFHIFLPQGASTEAISPQQESKPPMNAGAVVLVAEDDNAVRAGIVHALQKSGFSVLESSTTRQALDEVKRLHHIDVLCTDGIMPGGRTNDLIEGFLTEHPRGHVVVCSGYLEEELLRRNVDAGRYQYLAKPFAPSALVERIRHMLGTAGNQTKTHAISKQLH